MKVGNRSDQERVDEGEASRYSALQYIPRTTPRTPTIAPTPNSTRESTSIVKDSPHESPEKMVTLHTQEASEIGERRSRQPPPPMSEFAKSRVSKAVDGGRLQDLVEAAVGSETGFLSEEEMTMDGLPLGVLSRQGNGGNQGWDW